MTLIPLPGWRLPGSRLGALGECSLVIPTYQRPDDLVSLLDALAAAPDPPAEVAVVDGTPNGAVQRAVRAWREGRSAAFDLLYVSSPKGLTLQRNAGIDVTSGRYVFFLDDDAIPLPGYFAAIRNVFEHDEERRIGAVGGAIVNQMDRPLSGRWRLRLALGLAPRVEPGTYHASGTSTPRALLKPFTGVRRMDILPGCAFAFRREVLERERFSQFFSGYSQGEDLEMSLRVGRGWTLVTCGDAHVVHNTAPGGRPGSFAKGRMEVRNRHFIWKRHAGNPAWIDRLRFWADFAFLFAMDAAWFLRRPWRSGALSHAFGVAAGAAECLFAPPRYQEPAPRRAYEFRGEEMKVTA